MLFGTRQDEPPPDVVVAVVDATNLRQNLRLVVALKRLPIRLMVAMNMVDVARRRRMPVTAAVLERVLGVPVVETIGIRGGGADPLSEAIDSLIARGALVSPPPPAAPTLSAPSTADDAREVDRLLAAAGLAGYERARLSDRIDRIVLHPILGPLLLGVVLFTMFQGVFAWARPIMDLLQSGVGAIAEQLRHMLPPGPLASLLIDGVLAGTGSVLVFLPQILILFFFILVLEDSGDLPRAAFLLDRLMGVVGLSGRSCNPRHHGHAHHTGRARSPDHDHDRAPDDLFGAPAGLCAPDRRVRAGTAYRRAV